MSDDKYLVHIIMTGGTIDSVWDPSQDAVVVADHSLIPEYIKSLKLQDEFEFTEVCMKDSRALTSEDLALILKTINGSKAKRVIITHGTYTILDTARFLEVNLKRRDQTIILVGAKTPLKGFDPSDAALNLKYVLSEFNNLKPGIYIVLNEKTFSTDEVAKNIEEGKFYSVFREEQ